MIRVPGVGLHVPMPHDVGWNYAGTQAVDHFFPRGRDFIDNKIRPGHSQDARNAVQQISLPYRTDYENMGDLRMFAALTVGMSDIARAEACEPRATHAARRTMGGAGVVLNAALQLQTAVLSAPERTNNDVDSFSHIAASTLVFGGPRTHLNSLDFRSQLSVLAGLDSVNGFLGMDLKNHELYPETVETRRRLVEPVITDIANRLPLHFGERETLWRHRPEEGQARLSQSARLLGSSTFELTAIAANLLDKNISYERTCKIARAMGASGILMRQLTTVHEDLENGVLTLATSRVLQAMRGGGFGNRFVRDLRDQAYDIGRNHRTEALNLTVNKEQRGMVKALTTEMFGKLEYNSFRRNGRWVTAKTVRAAFERSPFA